jgi:hypothetical protein
MNPRKVQVQDKISVLERSGILLDVQSIEQVIKLVLTIYIIVGIERTQPKTFPKPTRTYEKELFVLFHERYIHGLIHIIIPICSEILKIPLSVSNRQHDASLGHWTDMSIQNPEWRSSGVWKNLPKASHKSLSGLSLYHP